MANTSIDIPVASVARDITIEVKLKGLRRWHLRLRLGIALMRFAIWVTGMGFEIEGGPRSDAANDERYGNDEHLTDLGKESIGILREMRAEGYPRLKISQFLDHELGRCHASKD